MKSNYIAMKVWTREDIANMLRNEGFKDTENNIDLVINTGMIAELEVCTDAEWNVIRNAIFKEADALEKQVAGDTMIFESPEHMLSTIQDGIDLYNVISEEYVFVYNDSGSIAVYSIDLASALDLETKSKESGEYWGAFLGIGGAIWDDQEHDSYIEGNGNMDFCKSAYKQNGWINVTPYPIDKKPKKPEMYTFEVYDCDNLDDYDTFKNSEYHLTFNISSKDVISKFDFLLGLFEGYKYRLLDETGKVIISGAFDPNDVDDIRLIQEGE